MSTQKLINKNIRKLTKVGQHSFAVTLPMEMVKKLNWREKQKVVVTLKSKTITIKDWKK
ncbi:MAG: AbrB/MazE/SpoVT family DNA-binding domain-containing protein [Patescibacteria group bacterium]|nr:AbrB/MazE/SpoVT family DNA-binding domain-containing protein [Patescibacteria group bacterium]